jgi:hypothetical protein
MAFIEAIYTARIGAKIDALGSTSFMWKVLRLPMEFFTQRMAGDIQQRKGSNASVAKTLADTFAPLVIEAGMMVFYLVVMVRYSLLLTLVGILSIVINMLLSRIISKKRVNITRVSMRDMGKLVGATVAGIEMIETIKASGADVICYGAPVLPGAMFSLAYFDDGTPVMGLPGCVMYAKTTIFDLVLPRITADIPITKHELKGLGHGGLCLNCPVERSNIAPMVPMRWLVFTMSPAFTATSKRFE